MMMKNKFEVLGRSSLVVAVFILACASAVRAQEWGNPVWSDEFGSNVAGSAPDASTWKFESGGGGWGNQELEIYCATGSSTPAPCDAEHPTAFQDGKGHLIIRATRVSAEPAPTGTWTSARLKTAGLKDFQYGRVESCMKLPVGAGLWPAFWMMGTGGKWPTGGEMDIMENIPATGGSGGGLGPTKVESTIHGPSTAQKGLFSLSLDYTLPNGQRIDDTNPSCHVYGAIWSPFMVQMYVDDWRRPFYVRTAADVPGEGRWVFNAPFYFLLNLAVGGDWPGPPNETTPSPAEMVVDYVRVFKAARIEAPKMTAAGPVKMQSDGGSGAVQLNSGGGLVYLGCASESVDLVCTVDTGNVLNGSVLDFGAGNLQTAKILVKRVGAAGAASRGGSKVTVTAYTVSGDVSSLVVDVD
jgi:beta-glucanase (GH16 family)